MGQYYKIVNVDRKEMLEPFDYGNGMKLMEWSWQGNPMVLAMMNLLYCRWAGDRVYVIGEYADDSDPGEPCHDAVVKLMEELQTDDLTDGPTATVSGLSRVLVILDWTSGILRMWRMNENRLN